MILFVFFEPSQLSACASPLVSIWGFNRVFVVGSGVFQRRLNNRCAGLIPIPAIAMLRQSGSTKNMGMSRGFLFIEKLLYRLGSTFSFAVALWVREKIENQLRKVEDHVFNNLMQFCECRIIC